jgi:hypothetical protein
VKRQTRESIEAQKHQMIAALYANSAFDENGKDGGEARIKRIKSFEEHFNRAIEFVYNPERHARKESDIDWNNPFWAAAKRAQQRRIELARNHGVITDDTTVAEVVDISKRNYDQIP